MLQLFFVFIILVFAGCEQKSQVRQYTEIIIEPSSSLPSKLVWDVPSGWTQEAGNAMRLVSFHVVSDPQAIDCSIVSLGGMAGGIEANLSRWMKQIDLVISDEEFDRFLRFGPQAVTTKTGGSAATYDFTQLQKEADGSMHSMIVAVLYLSDATVFIKMAGSIEALKANHQQFLSLIQSIRNP